MSEPRTDEELAAKLRGQLDSVVSTLNELQERGVSIRAELCSDDCDRWFHRLVISRTTFL